MFEIKSDTGHADLADYIEHHLLRSGQRKSTFCARASGNSGILDLIKAGHNPRFDVLVRIIKYCEEAPSGPGKR